MSKQHTSLSAAVAAVRPALNAQPTTEAERAQFLYDLVREAYDHVKFDLHGPTEDTEERTRFGSVLDAALPPLTSKTLSSASEHNDLAAAVEFTLEMLDIAERSRSFPDEENERHKQEAIKLERRRYKELRANLVTNEAHGVPVARDSLELALGQRPTSFPDDAGEELYEQWLQDQRAASDNDQ